MAFSIMLPLFVVGFQSLLELVKRIADPVEKELDPWLKTIGASDLPSATSVPLTWM